MANVNGDCSVFR